MFDVPPTMPVPPSAPAAPVPVGAESIGEFIQGGLALLIVLAAAVFLIGHFTGALGRFRRKRTPDVPVGRLVRRKKDDAADDCCR